MTTIERIEDIEAGKEACAPAESTDIALDQGHLPEDVFRRRLGAFMTYLKGSDLRGPNFNADATRPRLGTWDLEPATTSS
jgi:hypothetical protein